MSITKGNKTKVNFVRNKEIIDAEKCEYYVGKNNNLKSRQTQTKLGAPKNAYNYIGFPPKRTTGARRPKKGSPTLRYFLVVVFFNDVDGTNG